jgi:hypothetical protein
MPIFIVALRFFVSTFLQVCSKNIMAVYMQIGHFCIKDLHLQTFFISVQTFLLISQVIKSKSYGKGNCYKLISFVFYMNLHKFRFFLKDFEIEDEKVNEILKGKKILTDKKFGNAFLVDLDFKLKENQVYTNELIYLNFNGKKVESKFLLNLIFKMTKNIVYLKTKKQALNFIYSKDFQKNSVLNLNKINLKDKNYYLVVFENETLGYCKYSSNRRNQFENLMNIGNYLKEN